MMMVVVWMEMDEDDDGGDVDGDDVCASQNSSSSGSVSFARTSNASFYPSSSEIGFLNFSFEYHVTFSVQ